ncbi:MAG: hypothetical protein WCQ47_04065, partial [bacterium]
MKLRSFKLFVLLILFLQSCLLFSQTIKSINVKSNDGHQNIKFDPQSNIGLNYIQLYRSTKAVSFKFIVELEGDNLPEQMIMRTNTDKGPSYIHSLVNSLNTPREDQNSLENSIRHIIDILPKENTEPFLMSQSENPEFPVELYKDIPMKRTSMQNSGHVVYESAYLPVEFDQTSNAIFELKDRDGALKPVPLYYESSVHNKNIFVLNLVVSPKEASSIKIATVNPIQLGDVTDEKNATSFKVVDREKWKKLYLSGNTEANEKDLFVYEKFPVKSEVTQKMGFLKAKQLDSPSMVDRIIKTANETNANTVWLMPINENSPLRMSPELKEARMVKIGDQYYLVSNILQTRDPETGEKTGIELPHKGLYYQHETVAYSVSKYFGGNEAASSLIGQLNNAGLRVMVEEHPDKISSFGLEYSDLSPQAESIIKSILKVAGYEMAPESIGHPLNILTSKLKKISDGTEIFAYQFFTLKYNYDGKDVDKNSPDYVLKQNRLPGGPDEMPTKISEIYTTAIGRPGDDWATFVQLRVNNPYVELIEMIAKIDYYKRLFVKANQAAIRIDAVHFGLLRYDERSQFIRYLNEIRQTFPDII